MKQKRLDEQQHTVSDSLRAFKEQLY